MATTSDSDPPAFNLTETDREVLAMTDEQFILHDWDNLKDIIARNDLGALKRKPSDLARYLSWSGDIKAKYGSITNFICERRLGWDLSDSAAEGVSVNVTEPVFSFKNPIPFADPADYKILRNDWPYGHAPGIAHLCVWSRTPVPVNEHDGDLTDESRASIEDFVRRTFVGRLARDRDRFPNPEDQVLWFKNWTALQSVRSLEHIHVLVRDVPESVLYEWTQEPPADGVPS